MRLVSATETFTARESRETGEGSEGVDPPAEGWGGKLPDVAMLGTGLWAQERSIIVSY